MRAPRGRVAVWLAVGAGLLSVSIVPPAHAQAQPGSASTQEASEDADAKVVRYYKEGVKASEAGQWETARASFLEAWRLKPHWQIAANLGRAELKLGKYRDAAEHLTYALKEVSDLGEEDRRQMQTMLAQARAKVGELTVRVDVSGAEVLVDGQPVGRSPLATTVFVEPGKRRVEARREGYAPVRRPVKIVAGSADTVTLRLTPGDRPVVEETKQPPTDAIPPTRSKAKTAILITGAVVSAGALGVGVGSMIYATSRQREDHDLNQPKGCKKKGLPSDDCDAASIEAFDDYRRFSNVALWSVVAGGAFGLGTLVYAILSPTESNVPRANAAVILSPYGGSLDLTIKW